MHKHAALKLVAQHGHGARVDVRRNELVLVALFSDGTPDTARLALDASGNVHRAALFAWLGYF